MPGDTVVFGHYEICTKTESGVFWCKSVDKVSLAVLHYLR
jgi:hypothetical protein